MYPGVRPIIFHASWPIASTSCDRLFSAITVGSLRMIPWPREYTSVFAVPRSIARSLARPAAPRLGLALLRSRCERLASSFEVRDAGVDPGRTTVAEDHDQHTDRDQRYRQDQELHACGLLVAFRLGTCWT